MSQPGPPVPPQQQPVSEPVYAPPVAGTGYSPPGRINPYAIVALAAGVLSALMLLAGMFPFNFLGAAAAVTAVVFGHVSLVTIRRRSGDRGRAMGIAGLVLGYLGVGSIALLIALAALTVLGLAAGNW